MKTFPKDCVRPRLAGIPTIKANHPKFYTKAGWLTPYALACGYLELRGDPMGESNARLEQLSSGVYRVSVGGRWARNEYDTFHAKLSDAQQAFASLDHEAINARLALPYRVYDRVRLSAEMVALGFPELVEIRTTFPAATEQYCVQFPYVVAGQSVRRVHENQIAALVNRPQ